MPVHPTNSPPNDCKDDSVPARTMVDTLPSPIKAVGLAPIWQEMNDVLWQVIQEATNHEVLLRGRRAVGACSILGCASIDDDALLRTRSCPRVHLSFFLSMDVSTETSASRVPSPRACFAAFSWMENFVPHFTCHLDVPSHLIPSHHHPPPPQRNQASVAEAPWRA